MFEIGDHVMLRSSGPVMTVIHTVEFDVPSKDFVICAWLAGDRIGASMFNPKTLIPTPR